MRSVYVLPFGLDSIRPYGMISSHTPCGLHTAFQADHIHALGVIEMRKELSVPYGQDVLASQVMWCSHHEASAEVSGLYICFVKCT